MSNGNVQTDPVQALLAQTALERTLFDATSRYYGIQTETLDVVAPASCLQTARQAGSLRYNIIYLRRRFVPPPERFQVIQDHTVTQGERLDNIAAQYLGDPTLFWRLCDANRAMRPEELTETPGRKLRITLPEGVTGSAM